MKNDASYAPRTLYLDCFSGISGDMFIGALLDTGLLKLYQLEDYLSTLEVGGYRLETETVQRQAIAGTRFKVVVEENSTFRNLNDIEKILSKSKLPEEVKEKSLAMFTKLAQVESRVHDVPLEKVHFHEIGALDSLIDITSSILSIHLLGVEEVVCSPLPVGRGFIDIEHGKIPLPAPATAALLAGAGTPVYGVDIQGELVTPTGAALVTSLAGRYGQMPSFNLEAVGYGSGSKEYGIPNFLRVFVGSDALNQNTGPGQQESVEIIEANIDDLNPEISGYLMDKLLQKGAMDVYFTPIYMKKNRPAIKITVLSSAENKDDLMDLLFQETSTFGCRIVEGQKIVLPRRVEEVSTRWGSVRVKVVGSEDGNQKDIGHYSPEYEDCLAIAYREGIPLKEVYREVEQLYRKKSESE